MFLVLKMSIACIELSSDKGYPVNIRLVTTGGQLNWLVLIFTWKD